MTERYYENESRRQKEKEEILREKDEGREYDRLMREEEERMRELGFVPKVWYDIFFKVWIEYIARNYFLKKSFSTRKFQTF